MALDETYRRFQDLQRYVGWGPADVEHVRLAAPLVEPCFPTLIDDFYAEIDRHPDARRVITGGAAQIGRLKQSLRGWLERLFAGVYDYDYVAARWRVGFRHVEIGLDQVYTNAALSRLRRGLLDAVEQGWRGEMRELLAVQSSLNTLLDLDLAIIEDAYQAEFRLRQQRSDRLAAIGQVAGGVAHELRNPLNVVKTSVYFLLNARQPAPDKVRQHLERIERQVGLADGVITALADFARLPVPELQPVATDSLLRDVVEVNSLPDAIAVSFDCPPAAPRVLGDRRQLQIVFGNLVRNARDAMPQGGALTIRISLHEGSVEIAIGDSGVGIARENLERIMEPLYSTKARGIGLGLAITRSIIDKHGGKLFVASQPGQGTTFTVRLPAAREAGGS